MTCNIWSVFIKSIFSMHLLNMYSEDGSILGKEGWGVFFFITNAFY